MFVCVYVLLYRPRMPSNIPFMHWYGREDPYNVLILNCLGLTLEESVSKSHDIDLIFLYVNQMVSLFSILQSQTFNLYLRFPAFLSRITTQLKLHSLQCQTHKLHNWHQQAKHPS